MKRTLFITSPDGYISMKEWECNCNTEEELLNDFHKNNTSLEDFKVTISELSREEPSFNYIDPFDIQPWY